VGKNKFYQFCPPLEKLLKNTLVPPLVKSFRRPCPQCVSHPKRPKVARLAVYRPNSRNLALSQLVGLKFHLAFLPRIKFIGLKYIRLTVWLFTLKKFPLEKNIYYSTFLATPLQNFCDKFCIRSTLASCFWYNLRDGRFEINFCIITGNSWTA